MDKTVMENSRYGAASWPRLAVLNKAQRRSTKSAGASASDITPPARAGKLSAAARSDNSALSAMLSAMSDDSVGAAVAAKPASHVFFPESHPSVGIWELPKESMLQATMEIDPLPVTASQTEHAWQAMSLDMRCSLKDNFVKSFPLRTITTEARKGVNAPPLIHKTIAELTDGATAPFAFIEKTSAYNHQRFGKTTIAWAPQLPECFAREKAASELVERQLTPNFCIVYKTVVERPTGGVVTFKRYSEFAGSDTVGVCLQNAAYAASFAFELHAKLQVTTAFAVALKHISPSFYQGDLHVNNVVVQPLTSDALGVAQVNPFCATYKCRFLFRVIDFLSGVSARDYTTTYAPSTPGHTLLLRTLFASRRFALADVLYFSIGYDVTCGGTVPGKPPSLLTYLALNFVLENQARPDAEILEGLARMLLTFYEDPPTDNTLYGARSRVTRARLKTGRSRSRSRSRSRRRKSA